MKRYIALLFIFSFVTITTSSQNSLAKIEYGYAEEAFAKKEYKKALTHLEEVKKLLGSTNARVMYLEICSIDKTMNSGINSATDLEKLKKLNDLCSSYLSNFENEVPIEKIKMVYEIKKKQSGAFESYDDYLKGLQFLESKDFDSAETYLNKACNKNNTEACISLYSVYLTKNDKVKAVAANDKAIELGSNKAMFIKGRSMLNGMGGYNIDIKGKGLMLQAHESGYEPKGVALADLLYWKGSPYFNKKGKSASEIQNMKQEAARNLEKSKIIFEEEYKKGSKYAAYKLYVYFNSKDKTVLEEAHKKVSEFLENDPKNLSIGQMEERLLYAMGKATVILKRKEQKCNSGLALACYQAGNIYLSKTNSNLHGVKRDDKKAASYFKKSCKIDPGNVVYCTTVKKQRRLLKKVLGIN